jgi:hypothetical protein
LTPDHDEALAAALGDDEERLGALAEPDDRLAFEAQARSERRASPLTVMFIVLR